VEDIVSQKEKTIFEGVLVSVLVLVLVLVKKVAQKAQYPVQRGSRMGYRAE
jgi:hypothetical protein